MIEGIDYTASQFDSLSSHELCRYTRTILVSVQTQKGYQNDITNEHQPGDYARPGEYEM